jgi:hypothetical protein
MSLLSLASLKKLRLSPAPLAIGVATIAVASYFCLSHWSTLRDILSSTLARNAEKTSLSTDTLRSMFTDQPLVVKDPVAQSSSNHTHPTAAAGRSGGTTFIETYAKDLGKIPYFYQRSKSDERNDRAGSRSWFWTKDITVTPQTFDPPENCVLALVDVDHYVDMPEFLVEQFTPTIIYTFQPTLASRITPDYSYVFDENNYVDYQVTGGGQFHHQVWNYGTDHFMVSETILGIPWRSAVYLVDRRATDLDHELVLLTPVSRWNLFYAFLSQFLFFRELSRLEPVQGDFVRMQIHRPDGVFRSIGRVNSYAIVTVPAAVDDDVANMARTCKLGLTLPSVESACKGDKSAALALLDYHRSNAHCTPPRVYPLDVAVLKYQFTPKSYDPSAKSALRAFMTPLIHAAYAPDICLENEKQCIKGRIIDVKTKCVLTPFLLKVFEEFLELFIPTPHSHDPMDDEFLYEKQDRPSQRRIIEEAGYVNPIRLIKSFIKKEAYTDPKDPRPISTINGSDKVNYSKFIYTLAEHIKTQHWYAFGINPAAIAQRVVDVVHNASMAVNTDFSRFDGHVSNVVRDFERKLLIRFFRPQYHQEILDLHRSQFSLKAFSTLGVKYDTGTARASGSPETAAFNSLINAFTAFLALRMTRESGAFISPARAYTRLGIYGGDDGLTANVNPVMYIKAGEMIGQVLTVDAINHGLPGIKFLARVYGPYVWFGDLNSCCDLPRQLSKLHVTVALNPNVTAEMKLVEKMRSYFLTDADTPVIGPFAHKVLSLAGGIPETNFLNIWNSDVPFELQYPNDYQDWFVAYASDALPEFDFQLFHYWLATVTNLTECLNPPLCHPYRPAKFSSDVVVNDEVWIKPIPITSVQTHKTRQENPKAQSSRNQKPPPFRPSRPHSKSPPGLNSHRPPRPRTNNSWRGRGKK